MHFGEIEFKLFRTKRVNVYELRIVFGKFTCNNIRERVCRIERGQNGDPEQNGVMVQTNEVVNGFHIRLTRIHDIIDFAFVHQFDDGIGRRKSIYDGAINTQIVDYLRRTLRCVHRTAQIAEFLGNREQIEFVLIIDRHINAHRTAFGRVAHLKSRRNQALEHRFFYRFTDTEYFARRFHLRTELRVYVVELFKAEYGYFYRNVRRIGIQTRSVTEFFQLRARNNLGCKFYHRHACDLGNIGNGTGSSGVYFNDVQLSAID